MEPKEEPCSPRLVLNTDATEVGTISMLPDIALAASKNVAAPKEHSNELKDDAVPVTLAEPDAVQVAGIGEARELEGHCKAPTVSAMTLQDGETTTQFFIEHITSGASQLHDDSAAMQLDGTPVVSAMSSAGSIPVLLQVSEEGESIHGIQLPASQDHAGDISPMPGSTSQEPATMYTIHLTEDPSGLSLSRGTSPIMGDDASAASSLASQILEATADISLVDDQHGLQFLSGSTRLEDFMDVVTTYKCKFCRFSCAWKSGLMSHIRNCHMEASQRSSSRSSPSLRLSISAGGTQDEAQVLPTPNRDGQSQEGSQISLGNAIKQETLPENKQSKESTSLSQGGNSASISAFSLQGPIGNVPPLQERHIFLCGQCSKGFPSLEACKNHMIRDHNLKLESNGTGTRRGAAARRRGRAKARPPQIPTSDSSLPEDEDALGMVEDEDDLDDIERNQDEIPEVQGKRKVRPPKALEEDYYLGIRRKRVRRDSMCDRPFRCNERGCGYRFKTEANLQYHGRCHWNSDKPFLCPECGEKADHWRGLGMHLWKLHSIDLDLHTCADCGYKTYSLFKLDNHKRIHSDEREFICATCNKGFKQLSQLRNHHVIHLDRKNMPEKRWYSEQECDICNRTFSDSKCLRKHQQTVHNKLKPYICTYCGHMSARKAMLQLHMRQHTGEKPFVCEHCDYRTGDHNSLRRHRMRHTGTKPYKCPHCPYACIQAISYKTHLKNKHPGMEGLYACSLCTFRSVSKENYINHMSDHKRGAIPAINQPSHVSLQGAVMQGQSQVMVQAPAQLHLTENTLQQLEGILPGNLSAAQLIYSCLNALTQEGGVANLPPGVTTTSAGDGTQTITIQLPAQAAQELGEAEQYYLTIQQQDCATPGAVVTPTALEIGDVAMGENAAETMEKLAILHPISIEHQEDGSGTDNQIVDASAFITSDHSITPDTTPIIISTLGATHSLHTEDGNTLLQQASTC